MNILVIGAYGFIGQAIARKLVGAGHRVTGLGRSAKTGKKILPTLRWQQRDLANMDRAELWAPLLAGIDVVINASGALQDGARDDLRASQDRAIQTLIGACEQSPVYRYVQLSAVGADPDAATRFLRTKARADQRLQQSSLDWVVLRPGLVIGAAAYGGSAVLRMLAAVPWLQPLVLGSARIQCVSLAEVASVATRAAQGAFPPATRMDLVETDVHTLREVVVAIRAWLGVAPARWQLELPQWCGNLVARGADLLGYLGWRSPLRSTSLRSLEAGITGDPETALGLLGQPLMSLEKILISAPATLQDRWFSRLYLAMPLMVVTLAAFWVLSGVIALVNLPQSAAMFANILPAEWAFVSLASVVDIGLGLAVLFRPWARYACWGMVIMTLIYLIAGTVYFPELWSDPLGPLLKPIPAMVLALITPALLVDR